MIIINWFYLKIKLLLLGCVYMCVLMYYIRVCVVSYLCKKHKAVVLHKQVLGKTERGRSRLLKGERETDAG